MGLFFCDVADEVETCFAQHVHPVFGHSDFRPLCNSALRHALFGLHLREEQHLLNEGLARHEHHQTVDADADTRGGRHTVLKGAQEVLVDDHSLVVSLVGQSHLLNETLLLIDGVVQLAVGVCQLLTVHHQLETLGQSSLRTVHLGQWRHLDRIVGDEGRLDERAFAELAEELINQFALAHGLIDVHTFLQAEGAYFLFALSFAVEACLLFDGLEDGQTTIGSFERDDVAVNLTIGRAVDSNTNRLQQLLGERHHPVVVLVLHIELHAGELGVVVAVHALVAEVLANLIHALETADNQSLQIELGGNAHIHVLVERVEMGDERTGGCTSGDGLEGGSFDFSVSCLVQDFSDGANDGGTLQERVFHAFVDNEVDIALTITQFGVVKLVVGDSILVFHDGQRLQGLRQQYEFLGMNADLARLGAEHITFHANEVANVEQTFEDHVVQILILVRTQLVA